MIKLVLFIGLIIGFIYLWRLTVVRFKFKFDEEAILMFFGLPGSGKTTVLADIVRQMHKKKKNNFSVYCNFPIHNCLKVDRSDIGKYEFRQEGADGALILLDEGQTVYNCRNAMSKRESERLNKDEVEFFCMHRHRKTMVCCFSQGFEDMDKIIRNRTTRLYYVEKSRLRPFVKIRTISKMISIDELQKQIIEGFEFERFSKRYVYGKRVWKMFDTYACPELPVIEKNKWYESDIDI